MGAASHASAARIAHTSYSLRDRNGCEVICCAAEPVNCHNVNVAWFLTGLAGGAKALIMYKDM